MKKLFLGFIAILFIMSLFGCQQSTLLTTPDVDGEKLVRALWEDFNKDDKATFEKWLSPGFQSVHEDKARNMDGEINLLMALHLGAYTLDNFISTQDGNVLIVTYTVAVHETIDGEVLPGAPAERLTVFMHDDKNWKWIAHANLNPMEK
ncbi:MAG: nuclear transport factor 2 family protein [Candidatus Marinimicrobia bacterium]|nr:nuclear transport factor 2 family protein [Candidatus Neomarinimicrobiota bacterium]